MQMPKTKQGQSQVRMMFTKLKLNAQLLAKCHIQTAGAEGM